MTLFRKFLILFRTLFFFIRPELYIKQAEVIDPRLLVTHIQFPASRSRSLGFGCRSSSAPTTAVRWPSTSPSHPRHLRIVLPVEERVPAPAPRYLQGAHPVDYSVAFCSYFVIQNAGPAGTPSVSLISSSRD